MIEYVTQVGPVKVKHVLFANRIKPIDTFKLVSYSYMRNTVKNPFMIVSKRQTRIIDLTQNSEAIFSNFGYYTRRAINRAKKQDFTFTTSNELNEFTEFYNEFARLKNIEQIKKKNLNKIPSYVITKLLLDGKPLVMKYFITDYELKLVRGFYGASLRLDKNVSNKIASMANRLSHFEAIKYFKEEGFDFYDLGGTAEHTKKKTGHQIDLYKKHFGGYLVDEYQYESIPHYLAINLKALLNNLKITPE